MADYFTGEPRAVKPGDSIEITNKCKSSFRVGTGIMFESDGEYHVIINGNRVTVQEYYPPNVCPVKRGKWIPVKPYNNTYMGFKCSECGAQFQGVYRDNYCGNCGADMREE